MSLSLRCCQRKLSSSLTIQNNLVKPVRFLSFQRKYLNELMNHHHLEQACTTYGSRAKFGPRKLFIWPAKPKILSIKLVCWKQHPQYWSKHIDFGPLISKKKILARLRFELCTPDLEHIPHDATVFKLNK